MTDAAAGRRRRRIGLVLGPALAVVMLSVAPPGELPPAAWRTAAVVALMAAWWVTEAIPIAATALLPLVLFPLLGVGSIAEAAAPFAHPVIFLFLGGFLLAQGVQRHGLHRRIALALIALVGGSPDRIVAGFMVASALLSMWVSNTATAVMMLPIALTVIAMAGVDDGPETEARRNFAAAMLLGVAYGATIGGLATLVGTPPNALLAGFVSKTYGIEIGFARWMLVGLPVSLVLLPLAWLVLTRISFPVRGLGPVAGGEAIQAQRRSMGLVSTPERRVAAVFGMVVALWVFGAPISKLLPAGALSDSAVAIAGALLLFIVPAGDGSGKALIGWEDAARVPWGVLILFGGGLSLASAIDGTGLAAGFGDALKILADVPTLVVVAAVAVVVILLTELTSNTATAAVFLPIAAALATGQGANAMLYLIPVTLAASCAFMMPVATPPNAVVFGSGRLSVIQMVHAGIWLNLIAVVVVTAAAFTVAEIAFDPAGRG